MHTNTDLLGFEEPLGMVDFYPNYGSTQPGCSLDALGICSHMKCIDYFAESINNQGFLAIKCKSFRDIEKESCKDKTPGKSYTMRPDSSNFKLRGIFYMETNGKAPYSRGNKGLHADEMKRSCRRKN